MEENTTALTGVLTGKTKENEVVNVAGNITNIGWRFKAELNGAKIGRNICAIAVLLATPFTC